MRPIVEIVYYATAVKLSFLSEETARAAYDKISSALKEYQRFKNDRAETVEVDTGSGMSTLKLERMDAVLFSPLVADFEKAAREDMEMEKKLRDMREELGLPPQINQR